MTVRANTTLSKLEQAAVLELRHEMHRDPEISNAEYRTQARILEMLERFGLSGARKFHNTGVYIDIDGSAAGAKRTLAVRGDIDALPIQEEREDLPFKSQNPGVMHACGHDVHASVAMGTALALHRMRENFSGKVRVFFHPAAEAGPVGGRTAANQRLLEGFERAVGFHVNPEMQAGTVMAEAGAITTSTDQFRLRLVGELAHGAMPYKGVDTITMAAAFINEVQKVVTREMPVDDGSVVSIGTIHGGEATNIVCPETVLEGTIRTRSTERRDLLCRRVQQLAEGLASLHRGRAEFTISPGEPPVRNDAEMVARFRRVAEDSEGLEFHEHHKPAEGSDDFGYYSAEIPSIYFWIGSREEGNVTGLHTSTFGVSDEVVLPAADLSVRYCLDLLTA